MTSLPAPKCECCGEPAINVIREGEHTFSACSDCSRIIAAESHRRRHDTCWIYCRSCGQKFPSASLDISHCDDCRKNAWPPKDPETRLRMAQILGAMLMVGDKPQRAVDIRRYLGGNVVIWPWMLDELAAFGLLLRVNPGDRRRGGELYAFPDPVRRHPVLSSERQWVMP